MSNFDRMFDIVVGHEGGFTDNPADRWQLDRWRDRCRACRGTKFGISAAAYPESRYRRSHRRRGQGTLPARLLAPDRGRSTAARAGAARIRRGDQQWQRPSGTLAAAGRRVAQDGVIGPQTLARIDQVAARPDGIAELCVEFLAQRLAFMATLPTWRIFGLGWARRLCRLPYEALASPPERLHLR